MVKNCLLNSSEFEIYDIYEEDEEYQEDEDDEDYQESKEKRVSACKRLIDKWTPELETKTLEAFINFYYSDMYQNWGSDSAEEFKKYWPVIKEPKDLLEHTGSDVLLYALEDSIYAKSKTSENKYESQNIDICVILTLDCPWDEDHGWAAVFVDENFVKIGRDIVDCVWLD